MIQKVPLDIIDVRYLLSMILVLVASIKKRRSTFANALVAILITWVAFGSRNTLYLLASTAINIFLLWSMKLNEYHFTVLNIANLYLYKLVGRSIEPRIRSTFDISGILMILTVKMGYVSKNFDRNLRNVLEYIFFVPGLVSGPVAPYSEFIKKDRMAEIPFPKEQGLKTLGIFIVHAILRSLPLKNGILDPKRSFLYKLVLLYLFNLGGRTKFHFAWNFAHCCFILYNLPEYLNIDFNKVEFTESVREISKHWNRFISQWLRTLFFDPIREKSMAKAVIISHVASAALHGINPCYLIFTISFGMYSKPICFANEILRYKVLKCIQMVFFVSYFSMPFYLLDLKELYQIWKNLYFFGHIYCTFWFILYWGSRLFRTKEKPKKE